jgi:hypothetical protein
MARSFELVGLDGTNPLGFLAALGTLASLQQSGVGEPKLGWKCINRWIPVLNGADVEDEEALASLVAESLRGRAVPEDAEARRAAAQKAMELAKTAIKKKRDEIKKRGLRGSERTEAEERELRPLELEYEEKRRRWLDALREAVPRPELALGKRIDCTREEYRDHGADFLTTAHRSDRESVDLLAAFGIDSVRQRNSESIEPTPFCFITGSGHQYFLETARQLMAQVTPDRVLRTLFKFWDYSDEGLSMRWDPIEDRRYALMDRDPTAPGNKPRTMWMANLLAYRGLVFFPTAAVGGRLYAAGWDPRQDSFTWPLWEWPLCFDAVRSLVQLRELVEEQPDAATLRARGVAAAYRANRVVVGSGVNRKVNFSPARRVV